MDNRFEVRYTVTKQRYLEQAGNPIKANRMSIVWIVLMGISLYYAYDSMVGGYWLYGGFYLLIALFSAYRAFYRAKVLLLRVYRKTAVLQGAAEWPCVITLGEEIAVQNGSTGSQYRWEQIEKWTEDKDGVILLFGNKTTMRLRRSEFTLGNADGFITFLRKEHPDIQQVNG